MYIALTAGPKQEDPLAWRVVLVDAGLVQVGRYVGLNLPAGEVILAPVLLNMGMENVGRSAEDGTMSTELQTVVHQTP